MFKKNLIRQHQEELSMAYRYGRRKGALWKKRIAKKASKATILARQMGTKVFYTHFEVTVNLTTPTSGSYVQTENFRSLISGHDDFPNFENIFGRIQCTSVAIVYRRSTTSSGAIMPLTIACYDSDNATDLTSFQSGESFAKKMYINHSNQYGTTKHAFKLEQAAYTIQNTDTFSSTPNILGYYKLYSPSPVPNAQVFGTLTFSFNLYFYDRK